MSKPDLKIVQHRPRMPVGGSDIERLQVFAQRIGALGDSGIQAVFAEAEHSLAELSGGHSVQILLDSAGSWRDWRHLDVAANSGRDEASRPPFAGLTAAVLQGDRLILPIRARSVVAWVDGVHTDVDVTLMGLAASYVDLAIAIAERHDSTVRNTGELHVLQEVATRILQSADLDEVLLLVTHETKRLLASDICGVLMLEDDELVMRSCVGYFSVETAKLRMPPGVGVAGRSLANGTPFRVENYVESDSISQDFMPLARVEKVRSALAVPIRARESMIGVLEVWRRRTSVYTDLDTQLLLALSGLAALAIDNARLLQSRARAVERLGVANEQLGQRIGVIEESVRFQERVVHTMLGGGTLATVIKETALHTGGTVVVFDRDLNVEVIRPAQSERGEELLAEMRRVVSDVVGVPENGIVEQICAGHMHARPILAGNELLGWIGWFGKSQPDESARLVLSHVSLAVAMHLLERRNTTRARSQTLQSVLWDLLEGDDETRSAALDRARELKVPIIKQPVAVLVASIARGQEPATEVLLDEERDRVLDIVQRSEIGRSAAMFGIRGTQLRLICKAIETARLRDQILRLIREIQQEVPRVSMACGFSSPCNDVREMPSHLREASIALEVARYRRGSPVAAYSESGVLGLLINLRSEADVRRVAQEILGGLMGEPEASRKMLLDTLRTFFECDCSQAATALSLGAHQKTIAYRLSKVTKLTGLKLAKHQDRLLADIGTRLYFMLELD